MNAALEAIANHFTDAWLADQAGTNELQCLWRRKDALATIELVTFGSALKSADAIDHAWTGRQIKIIRGSDANNRRGAFFEVLGLGYFAPTHQVTPAAESQPGYDLNVKVSDDYQLRMSLKCYSESVHERNFRKKAEQAREKFLRAYSGKSHAVQVVVEALIYPSESEWQRLYTRLIAMAGNVTGWESTENLDDAWIISLTSMALPSEIVLSRQHLSYTFICVAPYHGNEHKNFLSKLEGAVSNAEKHLHHGDKGLPWVMIRLPPTASRFSLQAWAQEYLNGLQSPNVLGVSFLQPYVVVDSASQKTYVAHHFSIAVSPGLVSRTRGALKLVTPFGVPTLQPPLWQLHGSDRPMLLNDRYIHQSGKHFLVAQEDGFGLICNVSVKAPGIEQLAVFHIEDKQLVVNGLWGADLLLIGG